MKKVFLLGMMTACGTAQASRTTMKVDVISPDREVPAYVVYRVTVHEHERVVYQTVLEEWNESRFTHLKSTVSSVDIAHITFENVRVEDRALQKQQEEFILKQALSIKNAPLKIGLALGMLGIISGGYLLGKYISS